MNSRLIGFVGCTALLAVVVSPLIQGGRALADAPPLTPWFTDGNAGTTPGTDFVGTTDAQALVFKVNNVRALQIEPNVTSPNLIGGFSGNSASAGLSGVVIGGGGASGAVNAVTNSWGTISGGASNSTTGLYNTVSGGQSNAVTFSYGTIGGGQSNTVSNDYGTIGGGFTNTVSGQTATVGGGSTNTASGQTATVGGGQTNTASSLHATIGGGFTNTANAPGTTVGGGQTNTASGVFATLGGGFTNTASGSSATLGGGSTNTASGTAATVGGGYGSTASAAFATIAGGGRSDTSDAATGNRVTDDYGSVGGGGNNQAGDNAGPATDRVYSTVGGGLTNTASGGYTTVSGGRTNIASGGSSSIGGGQDNTTSAIFSTVSGGRNNTASGTYSTVAGGVSNLVSGAYAAVPGGVNNAAAGFSSFAAGYRAKANHAGSFVWADNTTTDVASTGANQFIVRASGGVWLGTTSAPSIPAGQFVSTSTGAYLSSGGAWTNSSDRNAKTNITAVDGASILEKVAAMPMAMWNYKVQDASVQHIGPMAQDFAAAFGVGEDDTHIATIDADGVALAAIQGLNAKVEAENIVLKARLADLERGGVSTTTAVMTNGTSPLTLVALAIGMLNILLLLGGAGFWLRGRNQRA